MNRIADMRKEMVLFVLAFVGVAAFPATSSAQRLGIEAGAGYSQLQWARWEPAGPWRSEDKTGFAVTPSFRIHYLAPLNVHVALLPFAGYDEAGGRSDEPVIHVADGRRGSGSDTYRLHSLEAGVLSLYRLGAVRAGPGIKVNALAKASRVVQVDFTESGEAEHFRFDVTDDLRRYSASAGARAEWSYSQVLVSVESWFGLQNLHADNRVRQNQFRVGVGWRF